MLRWRGLRRRGRGTRILLLWTHSYGCGGLGMDVYTRSSRVFVRVIGQAQKYLFLSEEGNSEDCKYRQG